MLFATYQPGTTVEKLQDGKIEPYTIWAVPVEDLQDLFLSLFCSAPNRMEALLFFECENYIRLDKVKWYQALKDRKPDVTLNPRDCASDAVDNLHSEFLVEGISKEDLRLLVPIFNVGETTDILDHGSLKFEGPLAEYMRNKAKGICAGLHFSVTENVKLGMSEEYATYREALQPKRVAFELVYLPLAYTMLKAQPGQQIKANIALLSHMFSYHAQDYYHLSNDFTRWSIEDCSLEGFDAITEQMRHYILDNEAVAEAVANGTPIGRNDPCPCGSGKKFKKCHGQ